MIIVIILNCGVIIIVFHVRFHIFLANNYTKIELQLKYCSS